MSKTEWTIEDIRKVSDGLEGRPPQEALQWVADNFERSEFALACSLAELVLLDMLVKIRKDARIFVIDTGLLFKETYALKEKAEKRYGISLEVYSSPVSLERMEEEHGPELWKTDPDRCCAIRKVIPLKEALSGLKVWITGIRREQAPTRADVPIVGWDDKYGLIKVNPLAGWTRKQVWDYICANDVPYNELLDKGYPSIGCEKCTQKAKSGEDPRSGRWAGFEKTECGLHK
ncbi:MAG: phosphoadenylyl-sulfate reductase [Deltaproteobacteria bacterium]|nr:phosphoadenylyl-sulfate reductase [Deltaproteobacteria bacterium]